MNATGNLGQAAPVELYQPTQDECTFATLAHSLQFVGWWIAPLIIMLVKGDRSRFVKFHALQALLWQLCLLVFGGVATIGWVALIVGSVITQQQRDPHAPPPMALFVLMPLFWLVWMAIFGLTLTFAIVYAIKSGRGQWAQYPVIGQLARRILKF